MIDILKDRAKIADFIARFRKRLAGESEDLPETVRAKIMEVFGEPLSALDVARRIVGDVESRGDEAVAEYTRKFDGVDLSPERFRVTDSEIDEAASGIPVELAEALDCAAANVRRFQEKIAPVEPEPVESNGARASLRFIPLASAGINAPSGEAPHPSTVIMCAVPAAVAGVDRIVVVTPPGPDGNVNPAILAACRIAGVTEVYRIGGPQAIAAIGLGTETIPAVDKVVGPSNIFGTLAKKEIYGRTGIDMLAGPTEVVIVADDTARADFAAADMIAQAEHGPMCAAVLVTTSETLANSVQKELATQLVDLDRKEVAEISLQASGSIIIVSDRASALATANELAPEHLELMIEDASSAATTIRNAGAVFVGNYTPEAVGDYSAGPSHVLPTGGSARFFSGLSVHDFYRRSSVMEFSREALKKHADTVRCLARTEGLTGHLRSFEIRLGE